MKKPALRYYVAGSVSLITFMTYLPTLKNDFVIWDDDIYVLDNPFIRSFDADFFKRAFCGFYDSNWFPVTWISHALDYAVWGLDPMGHHLTNNILHAINTFIVVLLAVRLIEAARGSSASADPAGTGDSLFTFHYSRFTLIAAGVTGLLFGLHPLHVESVAWVAERKDLLCAFFYLLCVMAYVKYAKGIAHSAELRGRSFSALNAMRFRSLRYALCFFVLALMSKPMAVSLPFVFLILDWYPFKRMQSLRAFWTALIEKLPFIALSIGSSLLAFMAQKAGGSVGSLVNASLSVRIFVAFKALAAYLMNMTLPLNLVPFYPYPRTVMVFSPEYLLSIAVVTGITVMGLVAAKKQELWISGWGYFVITLLPVLGIVRIGSQEMADRYTYLPSLGPFLILGLCASWLWEKALTSGKWVSVSRVLPVVIAISAFLCLAYLTVEQIGIWKDSDSLWTYVIEKEPARVPRAYKNRANYFLRSGQYDKAVNDYDMVLFLDPSNYDAYVWRMIAVRALFDRGNAYLSQGKEELAASDFQKACRFGNEGGCNSLSALLSKKD